MLRFWACTRAHGLCALNLPRANKPPQTHFARMHLPSKIYADHRIASHKRQQIYVVHCFSSPFPFPSLSLFHSSISVSTSHSSFCIHFELFLRVLLFFLSFPAPFFNSFFGFCILYQSPLPWFYLTFVRFIYFVHSRIETHSINLNEKINLNFEIKHFCIQFVKLNMKNVEKLTRTEEEEFANCFLI